MQSNCHSNTYRISRDGKSCCEFHHKQYAQMTYDLEHLDPMEFLCKYTMPKDFARKMHEKCRESINNSDQGFYIYEEHTNVKL